MGFSLKSGPGVATFKLYSGPLLAVSIVERRYHKCDMMDMTFVGFMVVALFGEGIYLSFPQIL